MSIAAVQARIGEIDALLATVSRGPVTAAGASAGVSPATGTTAAGGGGFAAQLAQLVTAAGAGGPATAPAGAAATASLPAGRATGRFADLVTASARRWHVDPRLVDAVIAHESGFDPRATSPVGAGGLMQLMPGTARSLGVTDVYDPAQNIDGGTHLLRQLLDRFGDPRLALAGYSAGAGAVERYGGVPPYAETQAYVRDVMASWEAAKAHTPTTGHGGTP